LDFVARGVVALVGHDLQVVEAEAAAVEAFADDREYVTAFEREAAVVGDGVSKAILACL
jgi:hypothetical protein